MKLIIEIPEKVVTAIQDGKDYRFDIHTAIAQGIPYEERPQGEYICPFCNTIVNCETNFCSYCGKDMRKGGTK